jgi:hypothetical protein
MPIDEARRKKMLDHVARWEAGTLSKRQYCTRARIDYYQFHYWYRIAKDKTRKSSEPPQGFLPVRLVPETDPIADVPEITVTGASGLVARFPVSEASLGLIRQLLNG